MRRHVENTQSGIWLDITLTAEELEALEAAHERNKPGGKHNLEPTNSMAPIYNFVEEVLYGPDADLIPIPPLDTPSG